MHIKIHHKGETTYIEVEARTPEQACEQAKEFLGEIPEEITILQFPPKDFELKPLSRCK